MITCTRRELFLASCLRHLGDVVCWGRLDCSELVALGAAAVGLPDRTKTFRAQTYADSNPAAATLPRLGDLGFYGANWNSVVHVVICSFGGHVLSADGATSRITDINEALKNPGARVRLHSGPDFYKSARFLGWKIHNDLDP